MIAFDLIQSDKQKPSLTRTSTKPSSLEIQGETLSTDCPHSDDMEWHIM